MDDSFRVGAWLVQPSLNTVSRNGSTIRLEPKQMEVLVSLAQHPGEPQSKEILLRAVWGETFVSDDALTRSIFELRRVFEDDAREPRFIQTIPKRGYRLIAPVERVNGSQETMAMRQEPGPVAVAPANFSKLWMAGLAVVAAALLLVLLGAFNVGGVRTWLAGRGTPQIHSLAVLPLRSLSSDPSQEYFSDGLTDGLITDLAQISSLKVISHTSTIQYKDSKKSLPEIARELNVDGIVEGTVQRSGDRLRITARLIYGPPDTQVWANTYERDTRDLFALEREVTRDIANQVQARLAKPDQSLPAPRPVDSKVLEAYLQGNSHLGRYGEGFGEEEPKKAAEYFQQAIDVDPNFAPPYFGLAWSHMGLLRGSSEDAAIARRAAEKAVELDPNYSDARYTLGFLKWQLDWRGAEEEFNQAIALNPNNAGARYSLCSLLIVVGRADEGSRECNIAQQLDPNNDNSSGGLYQTRHYDDSIAILRMMLQRDPNNATYHCYLFNNYSKKNMGKEAIEELAQCWSLFGSPEAASNLRDAFAVSGYLGAVRQMAKELEHLQSTGQGFFPGNLATAYTILGDKDRAFFWLDQAYEHREMVSVDGGVFFLGSDPMYDPLRSDPRFRDLLRRVGLPP